jgi:hypothetical protein
MQQVFFDSFQTVDGAEVSAGSGNETDYTFVSQFVSKLFL